VLLTHFFARKRTTNTKLGNIYNLKVVLFRITTTVLIMIVMIVRIEKEKFFLVHFLAFLVYFL